MKNPRTDQFVSGFFYGINPGLFPQAMSQVLCLRFEAVAGVGKTMNNTVKKHELSVEEKKFFC